MENLYKITTEKAILAPLRFNTSQEQLWKYHSGLKHRGGRSLTLKVRKRGVTTFYCLYYLDDTIMRPVTHTTIMAHRKDDLEKIFNIVKVAYDTCPPVLKLANGKVWVKPKPTYDNKNQLSFKSINSSISVALENRGGTNHNLHISEAAHVEDESRIAATLGTVPERHTGSNISIESTANGVGGWYNETWLSAMAMKNQYDPIFFSWIDDPKYRITPPRGWKPSAAALLKAKLAKAEYGVDLKLEQLYFWDMKREDLKKLMDQEFPTVANDAFIVSGNVAIDPEAIAAIDTPQPITEKYGISIWKLPREGRNYVVAVDVAEGVGGDRSVISVIDRLTLEQVAEYASDQINPTDLGDLACKIGYFFNKALLAPERNNHGHTTIQRIKDNRYPNIFRMVSFDETRDKRGKKLGWETNSKTRDLMLDELEDCVLEKTTKINSAKLKSELQSFIITDKGKREAKPGTHDDRVIAFAIALKICRLPRRSVGVAVLD